MRFWLTLVLIFPLNAMSQAYDYRELSVMTDGLITSGLSRDKVNLLYEVDEDWLVVMHMQGGFTGAVMLNEQSRSELRAHISKYKEWREQAIDRQVELNKEIGKFTVDGHVWKGFGDASFSDPFEATVVFQSQSKNLHNMVLSFPEVPANNFEFSSNRMNTLYFDFGHTVMLEALIREDSIEEFVAERRAIESSFQ